MIRGGSVGVMTLKTVGWVALIGALVMTIAATPLVSTVDQIVSAPAAGAPDSDQKTSSPNWGGFVAIDSVHADLHGSIGTWVVPTVTCAAGVSTDVSEWVGLGGDYFVKGQPTESLYQTGTESDCVKGKPFYQPWQQQFGVGNLLQQLHLASHRSAEKPIQRTVLAGDMMTASVVDRGLETHWSLIDERGGRRAWMVSGFWLTHYAHKHTAECIVEDPEFAGKTLHLAPFADFGQVRFSVCDGLDQRGASYSLDAVGLPKDWTLVEYSITHGMSTLAYPSLHPFTVTWSASDNASMEPVVVCNTEDVPGSPPAALPSSTSVSVSSVSQPPMSLDSDDQGTIGILAPKGWPCEAIIGSDGSEVLDIVPPGTSLPNLDSANSSVSEGIEATAIPGCVGCMYDLACAVFPSLTAAMGQGQGPCPITRPPQEQDVPINSNTISFGDPPGVNGSWDNMSTSDSASGVMYFYPPSSSSNGAAGEGVCILPNAEHNLCTIVLNEYSASLGHPPWQDQVSTAAPTALPPNSSPYSSGQVNSNRAQSRETSCGATLNAQGLQGYPVFADGIECQSAIALLTDLSQGDYATPIPNFPGWMCDGATGNGGSVLVCNSGMLGDSVANGPSAIWDLNAAVPHVRAVPPGGG
jgi:hypothetical protein